MSLLRQYFLSFEKFCRFRLTAKCPDSKMGLNGICHFLLLWGKDCYLLTFYKQLFKHFLCEMCTFGMSLYWLEKAVYYCKCLYNSTLWYKTIEP